MNRIFVEALLTGAILAAVGCSSSSNNDSTMPVAGGASGTSSPAPGNAASELSAKFDGNFIHACELRSDDDPGRGSHRATINIDTDVMTTAVYKYTDTACAVPDVPAKEQYTASLSILEGESTTDLGQATHVDITPESYTEDDQPASAETVQSIRDNGGFDTIYTLMLESGGTLFIGERSDGYEGESPASRAIILDTETTYTRQ